MGTTGQSVTLANSIIGVGILAMPFCFQQCGILLATLILLSMGLVSRLCCYFLLKSALIARRRNFEFLAFHVFGPAGKLAVELGIIGFLMGTCIAYFVVVGDLGPQIIAKMFNINQSDILRTSIMVLVSLVCVLPLGLLRNVDSLSNVSAATIGFYLCLVLKVLAEATSQLLTGDWHTRLDMWKPSGMLQCVPIISMALFCQTQLFEIFESLPSLSLEKMNVVTKNAINICSGVYFTLGLFGYIAFCSREISGNILMSLSPTMANDVIKLGFVMSLAFSFPLIIFPCRASLYSFLFKKVQHTYHDHIVNNSIPETTFRCITVAIIAVALFVSLLIPNIELVLGLVGSTIGVMVCVIFPAACFINITFKNTNERILAKGIIVLGLIILVLGTYANLQAAEKLDRYDDKFITQERIDKMVEDFFKDKDDVIAKPDKSEPVGQEKVNKLVEMKDSEVQPPNPVPPESQSNEKDHNIIIDVKEVDKLKEVPNVEKELDKISESHPKNLKSKLQENKLANGGSNIENEKSKKENIQPPTNEEKNDIIKQQQLMETIKQHGEEQKELIKEQKEILHEIIKTKNEIQQNKKEMDSNEAKKIAVESIQKIANMAIQSLGGVSEKPALNEIDKKAEQLEKTANEAVQEIAKKAVETIEAIKDLKEEPKELPKADNIQDSNAGNVQINNYVANPVHVQSNNVNNQNVPVVPNHHVEKQNPPIVPKVPIVNNAQVQSAQIANNPVANNNDNQAPNNNQVNANLSVENSNAQMNINNAVPNQLVQNSINSPQQQAAVNNGNQNIQSSTKAHSHSPDEPQSYKQGEDVQKNVETQNVPKVPVALAMNGNSQIRNENVDSVIHSLNKETVVKNNNAGNIVNNFNNGAIKNNNFDNDLKHNVNDPVSPRLKREVDSKKECDTLVIKPYYKEESEELFKKVDLNDLGLPKHLPLQNNILIHHMRSLKSYDELDKKR